MTDAIKLLASRANAARAYRQNVPSPCVSVCRMDERTGLCQGCLRTIDEIRAWSTSDDDTRRHLWTTIEHRARGVASGQIA